jgi:hypothetical protein
LFLICFVQAACTVAILRVKDCSSLHHHQSAAEDDAHRPAATITTAANGTVGSDAADGLRGSGRSNVIEAMGCVALYPALLSLSGLQSLDLRLEPDSTTKHILTLFLLDLTTPNVPSPLSLG